MRGMECVQECKCRAPVLGEGADAGHGVRGTANISGRGRCLPPTLQPVHLKKYLGRNFRTPERYR